MAFSLGVSLFIFADPAYGQRVSPSSCTTCHNDYKYTRDFPKSVHGGIACVGCHKGIVDIRAHSRGEAPVPHVNCARCHRDVAVKYRRDVHYIKYNLACADCHREIHGVKARVEEQKTAVMKNCTACHDPEYYVLKGHGRLLLAGNRDAAACVDCHGLHNIPFYNRDVERDTALARESYTRRCRSCHADVKVARRNKLSTKTVAGYDQTYHGKVLNMGYSQRVAGCADCHGGHNILPKTDPSSSLYPSHLHNACRKCHQGAHYRMTSFIAHPDPTDRRKYPALYWAMTIMEGLLVGTFLFFWMHNFLWWWRAYVEISRKRKKGFVEPSPVEVYKDEFHIRRFSLMERVMHVLLIFSFFTLVLTGFPLKYSDTAWAKALMSLWGGAQRAGVFHRVAALVLCSLFAYTLWLSARFLFPGWRREGWQRRLFGPDSLFPNLQDLRDIKDMFWWFFHRGEMPRFDRWTYWEKVDFLAVFWGMTIIGGSGFILWFPEAASYLLPGWMLNVAHTVHSEGAFWAAVFTFSVHFFNNHLVPNKFPLETNIFTGRYRLAALREERPREYERLLREDRLSALRHKGPGLWVQLFAGFLGLSSLLLGSVLLVLILWSAFLS